MCLKCFSISQKCFSKLFSASLRSTAIPVGHFLLTATSVTSYEYNVGIRKTLDSCNLNGIVLAVKILNELTEELNRERAREAELRSLCWRHMTEIRKLIAQRVKWKKRWKQAEYRNRTSQDGGSFPPLLTNLLRLNSDRTMSQCQCLLIATSSSHTQRPPARWVKREGGGDFHMSP